MAIKALVFDAYGTLYDVHSVQTKTEELCPGKGDLITQIWRLKQLEYTWLQTSLQNTHRFRLRCARLGSSPAKASPSRCSRNISILIPFPRPRRR